MMMAMMMAIHSEAQTNKVYDKVEVMPEYPGGMEALLEYMMNNVKYPEEAMRLVNNMPKWKPGKVKGKAVRVSFALPVNFNLK